MSYRSIKRFIGNDAIFARGLEYFNSGRVTKFRKPAVNIITAKVRGERLYNVQIKFRYGVRYGEPVSANCTCAYAWGGRMCKHIAAVLIRNQKGPRRKKESIDSKASVPEIGSMESPIISDKDWFAEEQIIQLNSPDINKTDESSHFSDTLSKIKFLKKPAKNSNAGRHKLIFVIKQEVDNRYYGKPDTYWIIKPALRYIKKSGEHGALYSFNAEKVTEPVGEKEELLLYRLLDNPDKFDFLKNQIEFLLANKIESIFLKGEGRSELIQCFFEEIGKITIAFDLSFTLGRTLFFKPVLRLKSKVSKETHETIYYPQPAFKGGSIMFITEKGKILYKENSRLYYKTVLNIIGGDFTYNQIQKLKKAINKIAGKELALVFELKDIKLLAPVPKPLVEIDYQSGNIAIYFLFDYMGAEAEIGQEGTYFYKRDEHAIILRNTEYESQICDFLMQKIALATVLPAVAYRLGNSILLRNMEIADFLIEFGLDLINEGVEIRLKGYKQPIRKQRGRISISVTSGVDWFDTNVDYLNGDGTRSNIDIDRDLLSSGMLKLKDGFVVVGPDEIKKLQLLLDEGMNKSGEMKISKYNFTLIDELYNDITNNKDAEIAKIKEVAKRLKNFKEIKKYDLPKKFKGVLRKYQVAGYNWLYFLRDFKLNGCLADDMGLGKTIQTLAFLQSLKEKGELGTVLVVVPVVTIPNWASEIAKFTPGLKYFVNHSKFRIQDHQDFGKYDIIIVSYHTLRNDIEVFNSMEFNYIILDEAQNIKNAQTLVFKAVRTLNAKHKLTLTGTPIENNTLELWAQMDFLNPGLLGSLNHFKKKFARPIESYNDSAAAEKLKAMVFPFILRRRKEDVAKDLPPKNEIVIYSEMGDKQFEFYTKLRDYYRAQVMSEIEKNGIKKATFGILNALLKLRQASLFPALVDEKYEHIPSCKFEQLKNTVDEILAENHKILIFSQFVTVLQKIKMFIESSNLKYSYIDGSTRMSIRNKEIRRFQEDTDTKIFLLSIKAGGVGVNLTAADYVMIFDPWWNPAVEEQAIDRTHRIGQNKKVIAYKMIVKHSVEEKMLELQSKKKKLVKQIVATDSGFFKNLTKTDISNIFS